MPITAADHAPLLHVMVGVIQRADQCILIARRPAHLHQGGKWEFPGGKLEAGETRQAALVRELREELGIDARAYRPLQQVIHHYPERSVLLDVWRVSDFSGTPQGREGQAIAWVAPDQLVNYPFPAANLPIICAAQLPDRYWITPDLPLDQADALTTEFRLALAQGIRLVQLRLKSWPLAALRHWLNDMHEDLARYRPRVLVNSDQCGADMTGAAESLPYCDGIHLTGAALVQLITRPALPWVAASCHDLADLQRAEALGVDFATLSPVLPTASHPGHAGIGWQSFAEQVAQVSLPVYALGGMTGDDRQQAWECGAQGVAGIRGLLAVA